jgi:hypothetical protein
MKELITLAKENRVSLATFKPASFGKPTFVKDDDEWTYKDRKFFERANRSLFGDANVKIMPKIPYSFCLTFYDDAGRKSVMTILDWEISQLYLKTKSRDKTIEKLQTLIDRNELYLFLGTTFRRTLIAPNPFTIIGLFYPPRSAKHYTPSLF